MYIALLGKKLGLGSSEYNLGICLFRSHYPDSGDYMKGLTADLTKGTFTRIGCNYETASSSSTAEIATSSSLSPSGTSSTSSESSTSSLSTGATAGIVFGAVCAGLAVISGLGFVLFRLVRKMKRSKEGVDPLASQEDSRRSSGRPQC